MAIIDRLNVKCNIDVKWNLTKMLALKWNSLNIWKEKYILVYSVEIFFDNVILYRIASNCVYPLLNFICI